MLIKPRYPKLNGQHPLAKGLVEGLTFFEGAGIVVRDLSGKGNHGSFTGTWSAGLPGPVVATDGSATEVSLANTTSINVQTGDFTVSVWFSPNSLASSYIALFDFGVPGSRNCSLFLNASGVGNLLYFNAGSGAGVDNITLGTSITVGSWWNLTVTRRGSVSSFYLNGGLGPTDSTQTGTASSGGSWSLGLNPTGGGAKYNGKYGSFHLWNRALTPDEIVQLYSDTFSLYRQRRRAPRVGAAASGDTLFAQACL